MPRAQTSAVLSRLKQEKMLDDIMVTTVRKGWDNQLNLLNTESTASENCIHFETASASMP